ncbi:MAG: hypothetical protein MZU97_09470 [Bacillus subtilis]|nr:hypothetical protein [Bacillus subtilis]
MTTARRAGTRSSFHRGSSSLDRFHVFVQPVDLHFRLLFLAVAAALRAAPVSRCFSNSAFRCLT